MSYIVEATVGKKEKMDKDIDVMSSEKIQKLIKEKEELLKLKTEQEEEIQRLNEENEKLNEENEKLNNQLNEQVNVPDENIVDKKATEETKKSKRSAE